jgi:glycosyltransferase involved in cell wall biosynthesis
VAKVVFWLGPSLEAWDFATALERGIGGSETAAIHVARELARLGHEVDVYGNFEDGRTWSSASVVPVMGGFRKTERDVLRAIPYRDVPSRAPCDLFVSSRQPEARRRCLPHCRRAWLWVHDLHCGPDWDDLVGTDYDRVLCLSRFAREQFLRYYPGVDAAKVALTSNAVDATLFEQPVHDPRNNLVGSLRPGGQHEAYRDGFSPLRVTYSSSPDRGLDKLLDLWPRVCALASPVGRPELHVYYGFESWREGSRLCGNVAEEVAIDRLTARLARTPGVFHHGRAGQAEVARSYLRSQLWLYPTDFVETSCITAMEARAAGCEVVATRLGALPETAPGSHFVDGPTSAPGYDERFLAAVGLALARGGRGVVSDAGQLQVPTWAEVARQWDAWIEEEVGTP